jgi:ribosomal protein S18 acetylase RimI-like enzyme
MRLAPPPGLIGRGRDACIGYGGRLSDPDFVVRACAAEEAPAVLQLWRGARTGYATTDDRLTDVQRLLAQTPGSLLVADCDGTIVGALIAAWDGWRGNMYRLAVRSEHRRLGIGMALVRAGEQHLRSRGAHRITALVGYDDDTASAFWESAGYPRDPVMGRRVRNL